RLVFEAFCVDLVDVLCARWAGREPAVVGHDFQAVDRSVVARSSGQLGDDGLTSQARLLDGLRRQDLQARFLLGRRGRVDTLVKGHAELACELLVVFARILARAGRDLGCQQIHDRAVFVGRPYSAVVPQEAGAGTLLTTEAARSVE